MTTGATRRPAVSSIPSRRHPGDTKYVTRFAGLGAVRGPPGASPARRVMEPLPRPRRRERLPAPATDSRLRPAHPHRAPLLLFAPLPALLAQHPPVRAALAPIRPASDAPEHATHDRARERGPGGLSRSH